MGLRSGGEGGVEVVGVEWWGWGWRLGMEWWWWGWR